MSVAPDVGVALDTGERQLADAFVRWLETGERAEDLFAADVLTDLTVPHWRVQALGEEAAYRLREDDHPYPGLVTVRGLDRTTRVSSSRSRNGGPPAGSCGTAGR